MKSIKLTLTDDSPDHRAIHSVPAPLLGDPVVRCPGHAARITTASPQQTEAEIPAPLGDSLG